MRRAVALFFVVALCLRAFSVEAFHYVTPSYLQVPPAGHSPGSIQHARWGGLRYVLFDTDADILSNGSTGRQIYVFDLQERDLKSTTALYQMTTAALDDSQRPATGRRAVKIAYDAKIGGAGARQLMLVDRRTGVRTQLTNGSADSINASVDDGETVVVFQSNADFFNTGTAGTQIYRIDLKRFQPGCPYPCTQNGNTGLSQLTNKAGNSHSPQASNAGKVVAFESTADLLNGGENGNQIYLYDAKSGLTSRVTHGPGTAQNPSLSRDGGRLIFESNENLTGTSTGGTQIFYHRRNKNTMVQITQAPNGNCTNPAISSNGHAFAFLSPDNLLGMGSTGTELYSYDLRKSLLIQLTNAPGSVSEPAYASGVFIVFVADGDVGGNGTPGSPLHLLNLFALGSQQVP